MRKLFLIIYFSTVLAQANECVVGTPDWMYCTIKKGSGEQAAQVWQRQQERESMQNEMRYQIENARIDQQMQDYEFYRANGH